MRVRTGVEGFDPIVGGGLPEGTSVVLQGPPGNEKDLFGLQFLAEGLKSGEAVVIVISSQSPEAYLGSLSKLGVNVKEAIAGNRIKIVDWHSYQEGNVAGVEEREHVIRCSVDLTNVGIALSRALGTLAPGVRRRAVLEVLSPALQVFEVGQVYAFAQSSKAKLARHEFTALFLLEKEMHSPATVSSLSQPFDGVIDIDRRREGDAIVRKIGVLSMKDTAPDERFHEFLTLAGRGLIIKPEGPAKATVTARPEPAPVREPKPAAETPAPVVPPSNRAAMILRIAEERIKIDPKDADALFAKASALAAMGDLRGAIGALDALVEASDTYPGLWVLRAKLFARVGDPESARESRRKADEIARREEHKARTGDTVPCPLCEGAVPVDAHECPNCGARFIEEVGLAEELDSLGKAAIQDKVGEDLQVEPETGKPADRKPAKPIDRVVEPRVPASSEPTGRRGMTNGLSRESLRGGMGRTNGLTNGLKGRTNGLTNGLKGRTNGLTNGLKGRTNGLTNGLRGRTNGLTNGLRGRTNGVGRTNGITNGLQAGGRTNGLTNGFAALRRGMTNGLTNGNGFTNGLGSARFHREVALARWKLYVIPLLSVALLLLPLLGPGNPAGPTYPIAIDGNFSDWTPVPLVSVRPKAGVIGDIDLVRFGVTDNIDTLAFYFEVNGTGLRGGGLPPTMDAFRAFIDIDRNSATGYRIHGMGADRLIEISGWGGQVNASTLSEWDSNRNRDDWNGWIKATSIRAVAAGSRAEAEVDWVSLSASKTAMDVFLVTQGFDGSTDSADYAVSTTAGSLRVVENSIMPEILSGPNVQFLRLDLDAAVRPVTFDSIALTLNGTGAPTALSALRLVDGNGTLLGQSIPMSRVVTFRFAPRTLAVGQSSALYVVGDVAGSNGDTLGVRVLEPRNVGAGDAAVTISRPQTSPRAVGYLGTIPAAVTIDGGFSEWTTVGTDPVGDAGVPSRVDLTEYAFYLNAQRASAYFRVAGRALDGSIVPAASVAAPVNGPSQPDSDRDGVPDLVDPMPNDFNNDGTPDALTPNDVDGDGIIDYPAGPDIWLNTTIPANFPAPYAGRFVSIYIGPTTRPVVKGEDIARVYIDADNNTATGFRINAIGADYLVELRGKHGGVLADSISSFAGGANQLAWSWTPLGSVPVASADSRVELSFDVAGRGLQNNSRAFFELRDWTGAADSIANPTVRLGTRDIAGNQQWFFTNGATTGTGCTTNLAASTTAGSTATSTTLTGTQSICWFTPLDVPDTVAGIWEVILDMTQVSTGTQVLSPNANGDINAWVVNGQNSCTDEANEWRCVAETTNDGDNSAVISTSSSTTDSLYNIADWSGAPSPLSVVNINVESSCRKTQASAVAVRILVKSGGTTTAGATSQDCANSFTYTVWSETWTTNPTTAVAWTLANINALQAGVRDADATTLEVRVSHVKVTVTFTPVYSVEIDRCTNSACSTLTVLYGPTNGNTFGNDVTFTTGSIAAQTLSATERIRFKVTLVAGGSVSVAYNGAYPGTSDSRATVPIPEFAEITVPLAMTVLVILFGRRRIIRRARKGGRRPPPPSPDTRPPARTLLSDNQQTN